MYLSNSTKVGLLGIQRDRGAGRLRILRVAVARFARNRNRALRMTSSRVLRQGAEESDRLVRDHRDCDNAERNVQLLGTLRKW